MIIYLPMPEWQALAFMRNRREAFQRLLDESVSHARCALNGEVRLVNHKLTGFHTRDGAVTTGARLISGPFAIMRLSMASSTQEEFCWLQLLSGSGFHDVTNERTWEISADGVRAILGHTLNGQAVELLMDEIFENNS